MNNRYICIYVFICITCIYIFSIKYIYIHLTYSIKYLYKFYNPIYLYKYIHTYIYIIATNKDICVGRLIFCLYVAKIMVSRGVSGSFAIL